MEEDERPIIKNFTGSWKVDTRRSDRLDAIFAAMSVSWLTRKIVSSVDIRTHIYQTKECFIVKDDSVLGSFIMSLVPDGKWRCVASMRCDPAFLVQYHQQSHSPTSIRISIPPT